MKKEAFNKENPIELMSQLMKVLYREASEVETEKMRLELRKCLEQGAIGFSTGLAYATANESTTEEVISLAKEVHKSGGVYVTHLRNEFDKVIANCGEI